MYLNSFPVFAATFSLRTTTFSNMRPDISTWCQQKLNATGSGRLVEQWKHCTELQEDYV